MNATARIDPWGVLSDPNTLTLRRLLPGPIERVWAYLTEADLRRKWLAGGEMQSAAGTPFEFIWRNDELSDTPAPRPTGFGEESRMASRIIEFDPPNTLSFTWAGSGDVTIHLEPQAKAVLLTITHRRLPDRDTLLKVGAGWHMHLDTLVARMESRATDPFWPGWARLHDEYDRRLPR